MNWPGGVAGDENRNIRVLIITKIIKSKYLLFILNTSLSFSLKNQSTKIHETTNSMPKRLEPGNVNLLASK